MPESAVERLRARARNYGYGPGVRATEPYSLEQRCGPHPGLYLCWYGRPGGVWFRDMWLHRGLTKVGWSSSLVEREKQYRRVFGSGHVFVPIVRLMGPEYADGVSIETLALRALFGVYPLARGREWFDSVDRRGIVDVVRCAVGCRGEPYFEDHIVGAWSGVRAYAAQLGPVSAGELRWKSAQYPAPGPCLFSEVNP